MTAIGVIVASFRTLSWRDRIEVITPVTILGVTSVVTWWRSRDPATYSRALFRFFGIACSCCAVSLIYKLGVFTPIVVVVVLGLAFFVNSRDLVFATVISVSVIAAYFCLAVLVTTGVLPDTGIWNNPQLQQYISMTTIVTATMVTQLSIARANRRALHEAVTKSQQAIRVIRTREAQLDEARENLDVALRAANEGRLTGRTIGGYTLGAIVGRGAMGEVYAAERGAERVAIKVLRSHDDDDIAQRFVREAEIAQKVKGPGLVEVIATGRAEDGSVYIVMELLEGKDLAAVLRERTTLPLDEVAQLVEAAARGLDVLHAAGVIHRDLKPQNLFLSSSSLTGWKILDYGVSKLVGARTMTRGDVVGTPGYMSPEQAESGDVDLRSDVFSLGAVAYRALTGRRPFGGTDMPQILVTPFFPFIGPRG